MKLIFNVPAQQSAVELDSFIDKIVERLPECQSSVTHAFFQSESYAALVSPESE